MTVSDQEARAITFLAVAVRKTLHRAPTWDEPGIYDNVIRCRDMSLSEVILRTIRAAADRDAITPGVIPKNGPHANEVLKPPRWEPDVVPPEERCTVCTKARHVCESTPRYADDDHTFAPDFRQPAGSAVEELRNIKAAAMTARTTGDSDE